MRELTEHSTKLIASETDSSSDILALGYHSELFTLTAIWGE